MNKESIPVLDLEKPEDNKNNVRVGMEGILSVEPKKDFSEKRQEDIQVKREEVLGSLSKHFEAIQPNLGKSLDIQTKEGTYSRIPIKTPLIKDGDDIDTLIKQSIGNNLTKEDIVFVSEKIVAIAQGRAYKVSDIHPSSLATFLSKFVTKSKRGIGIGSPRTMQIALEEAGAPRILLATVAAALTKPFGYKGIFYKVAGNDVNAIDGPCSCTIPPYNGYAIAGPVYADTVAKNLSFKLGVPVVIIDANDFGAKVLGRSDETIQDGWCGEVFKDNPLGQNDQQTPVAIVRKK